MKDQLVILHAEFDTLSSTVERLTREIEQQSAVQSNESVSFVLADALRGLVGIAMHAVRSSETPAVDELVFGVLFEEPLKRKNVALAYTIVRQADQEKTKADQEKADKEKADKEKADKEKADEEKADEEKADEESHTKVLLRILRDLLMLQICGSEATRPWDNARMKGAVNSAFDKDVEEEEMSQHLQALSKIMLYGKDREQFDRHIVAKAYGEHLDPQLADRIFAAFAECAQGSPQHFPKAKVMGKRADSPARRQQKKRADSPAAAAAAAAAAWSAGFMQGWNQAQWLYSGFPLPGPPPGLGASSSDLTR